MNVVWSNPIGMPAGLYEPSFDEIASWVSGGESAMALSDEEKVRIREIEEIRGEVMIARMQQQSSVFALAGGPVIASCQSCGKGRRVNWRYCPFCGAPASGSCPRCHYPLPQEEGVQFCPQCGGRA